MAHILIVDDDQPVACSIRALLEYEGFEVSVSEDGLSGLAAAESGNFDLAIVDIFMPGMNGLETIKEMRERARELPIIAISGFVARRSDLPETDVLAHALELGAARSLHKPFRRRDIVDAVVACLHHRGWAGGDGIAVSAA
jgi:DNA-binding response OmpR family regulator